jgi:hypothetical protein
MVGRTPVRKAVSLQTGHLPFLTDVEGMVMVSDSLCPPSAASM